MGEMETGLFITGFWGGGRDTFPQIVLPIGISNRHFALCGYGDEVFDTRYGLHAGLSVFANNREGDANITIAGAKLEKT